ncbi:hypothetical protein [Amycolatopsis minnesotensis]|uniref:Uncharacterized protein n=1 Tax=Amycolatopsis minnesotensis TaxID=337894 RepID=A0ABP5E514_9PSEU
MAKHRRQEGPNRMGCAVLALAAPALILLASYAREALNLLG